MLNLENRVKYAKKYKRYIKMLGEVKYADWDSSNNVNKEIKESIKQQLLRRQNGLCVYCELKLMETSRPEVEHIAPRNKYPKFQYISKNLAVACQFCNGSSKKGNKDVIASPDSYYNKCVFTIVHPYYDNVSHFFDNSGHIIKINAGLSSVEEEKARNTISIFGLDDPNYIEARQKAKLWDEMKSAAGACNMSMEMLIEDVQKYLWSRRSL